jgi:hypothetical protein|tara:strand:- start:129 stop:857 length:729 start_codon:yes stop_codon:yes gene_type:complete
MKIKEYNQMMEYLTRPGRTNNLVKPKSAPTSTVSAPLTKAYVDKLKGLPQSLKKYEGVFRKPLQDTNIENLIADANEEANPKIIYNQGANKFEAMDPKDDAKVNKIYYNKTNTAKAIKKLADSPADVYEIEKRLELERPTGYDKNTGKFYKTNYDEKIFEPILDRLQKPKPSAPKKIVSDQPIQTSVMADLDLLKMHADNLEAKERSRLADEQFKQLSKKQYDPDLEKGLGYLMGVTNKENT